MEIIVIGGQDKVDLSKYSAHLNMEQNRKVEIFPELYGQHPLTLFNKIRNDVNQCIKDNISFYCTTYSDHVLNAIRLAIKDSKYIGAKAHQIKNNGKVIITPIDIGGRLSEWVDGVWDTWDNALMELL